MGVPDVFPYNVRNNGSGLVLVKTHEGVIPLVNYVTGTFRTRYWVLARRYDSIAK